MTAFKASITVSSSAIFSGDMVDGCWLVGTGTLGVVEREALGFLVELDMVDRVGVDDIVGAT